MTDGEITLENIRQACYLDECSSCEDDGVKINLEGIPERVIYSPEELDNSPRADCAIFFPEEDDSNNNPLYRHEEDQKCTYEPDYVSLVELKSSYEPGNGVREQLEGAIDFVIRILSDLDNPPWDLKFYCLIPHETGYKRRKQKRISKQIDGVNYQFYTETINSGEKLRNIVDRDSVKCVKI